LLQRYIRSDQDQLEEFMKTMYVSRGYIFDPEGSHSDIRNIELLYFKTGGVFWLFGVHRTSFRLWSRPLRLVKLNRSNTVVAKDFM
jgi:hypothetical protein